MVLFQHPQHTQLSGCYQKELDYLRDLIKATISLFRFVSLPSPLRLSQSSWHKSVFRMHMKTYGTRWAICSKGWKEAICSQLIKLARKAKNWYFHHAPQRADKKDPILWCAQHAAWLGPEMDLWILRMQISCGEEVRETHKKPHTYRDHFPPPSLPPGGKTLFCKWRTVATLRWGFKV